MYVTIVSNIVLLILSDVCQKKNKRCTNQIKKKKLSSLYNKGTFTFRIWYGLCKGCLKMWIIIFIS